MAVVRRFLMVPCLLAVLAAAALAQEPAGLSAAEQKQIDEIAMKALAATGVPSASVAVVKDGKLAYAHAYGDAALEPKTAATPEMRYSIGSISKQFCAAAILLLQQEGKLSLDDPVSKWVPDVTRAGEVTIRELLSHTSGYQDYWPQDYVMPNMLKPTTAQQILDGWARIPLDFDPGTKWQYSNTNFVLAGMIVEKASGEPFVSFLQQHVFTPLKMQSVLDVDQSRLTESDAHGYQRYALGPPRPAPKEGKGWLFAAGELAMTASDLARWDISMIDQSLLQAASYREMEREVLLKNGAGTGYGLGVDVEMKDGRRMISHGGEVSGFTADNTVFPDDGAAIVVLTNMDAAGAADQITKKITPVLFPVADKNEAQRLATARRLFAGLQQGKLERSLLTANCNFYFSERAIQDFAASLGPLGAPMEFKQSRYGERGGMDFRGYTVKFKGGKTVRIAMRDLPDGKVEQFQVAAE